MRRLIAITGVAIGWSVWLLALPLWLPLALVVDAIRPARGVATRSAALLTVYLTCEVVGIAALFVAWISKATGFIDSQRWIELHYRLEASWGSILHHAMVRLFSLRFEVEDDADLGRGPYLLLMRHTSPGDALIAVSLVSRRYEMRLRYVMKRELLWDPCLDIAGNRLPNVFIDRSSLESSQEIDRIRQCSRDLGPSDGVLIYPEGTRFSPAKRQALIDRFDAAGDAETSSYARSLAFVLPPRPGGVLALLDGSADADVVVCAHTGFEIVDSFDRIWSGELVGSRICISFERIPRHEIPLDSLAQSDWLRAQWKRVDAWVAEHRDE